MFKKLKQQSAPADQEKLDWLRLARTENVGPITFYRLLEAYGSPAKVLNILPELAKRGGRAKPLKAYDIAAAEKEMSEIAKFGADIITAACPDYPAALSAIDDAPPVITVKGRRELLNQSSVAMVGARNASLNGKKFASKLARDLGERRQIVISGLARGIDTAAHEGSLPTGTIAVVAGGIDDVYPEENTKLYEAICEQGIVIAESPFRQKPFAQSFPKRNRIVSGLSKAVIVVEATMRSGSLITARLAGEQGRDLYAVPGHPLDPRAEGPNHLIREGAILVRKADDVLEGLMNFNSTTLRDTSFTQKTFTGMDGGILAETIEQKDVEEISGLILSHLSYTPVTVDELIRACHVRSEEVQVVLLDLELAGRVKRLPGSKVSLV